VEGETRSVEIPRLGPAEAQPAMPPPAAPLAAPPQRAEEPKKSVGPLFWVGLGTAIAGLTTAAVTGGIALAAHGEFTSKCDGSRAVCSDLSGVDAANRATTQAWVSTIALGVGVAGGALMLLAPRRSEAVTVSFSPSGAAVGGTF
jgi:hypothetical protein